MQDLALRGNTKTGQHLEDSAKMSGYDQYNTALFIIVSLSSVLRMMASRQF